MKLPGVTTEAPIMSDEERARAMYQVVVNALKAKSKPWVAWEDLPQAKREKLTAAGVRLKAEYAAAGDPPSRGMR
ncbi:MAG: hypothetical protein ACRCU1_02390 [Alsobacter sp.]